MLASKKIHQAKETLKYHLNSGYWRGHHVHSPFVYHMVRHVITIRKTNRILKQNARQYRQELLADNREIDVVDYGTGANRNARRKISSIARNAAIEQKYGLMLARLIEDLKPKTIVELGTSLGISTFYMASAATNDTKIISIEGSPACAEIAKKKLLDSCDKNIDIRVGNFDTLLPDVITETGTPDFVYVDGNHTYEATIRYFNMLAETRPENMCIVFDDIHWSAGMSKAWDEICASEQVMTSIDLLHMGIVFFRTGCQKEFYRVRW